MGGEQKTTTYDNEESDDGDLLGGFNLIGAVVDAILQGIILLGRRYNTTMRWQQWYDKNTQKSSSSRMQQ